MMSSWTLMVRIDDAVRRELWRDVFFDGVVPVQSPDTVRVHVPERGEVDAYMLDLHALSDYMLDAVVRVLAERFGYSEDEVMVELFFGVPIVAENVTLICGGCHG